jgi:hypothetical protein
MDLAFSMALIARALASAKSGACCLGGAAGAAEGGGEDGVSGGGDEAHEIKAPSAINTHNDRKKTFFFILKITPLDMFQ